jgi:hypothetical protein
MLSSTKERREVWLEGTTSSSDHSRIQKNLTSLWHIQVPDKRKMFLWRLVKQSLLTADLLHRRHIAVTSTSIICGAEDSWRHSLIDCSMARCVCWDSSTDRSHQNRLHTQTQNYRQGCVLHPLIPLYYFCFLFSQLSYTLVLVPLYA